MQNIGLHNYISGTFINFKEIFVDNDLFRKQYNYDILLIKSVYLGNQLHVSLFDKKLI